MLEITSDKRKNDGNEIPSYNTTRDVFYWMYEWMLWARGDKRTGICSRCGLRYGNRKAIESNYAENIPNGFSQ